MDFEDFIAKVKERDAHIQTLTAYALELERLLREKHGSEAANSAESAWGAEMHQLRSEHGLRFGTLTPR